jgi:flavoprotein
MQRHTNKEMEAPQENIRDDCHTPDPDDALFQTKDLEHRVIPVDFPNARKVKQIIAT